jgi:hypothetical protein
LLALRNETDRRIRRPFNAATYLHLPSLAIGFHARDRLLKEKPRERLGVIIAALKLRERLDVPPAGWIA